jgi:hypothetical protein
MRWIVTMLALGMVLGACSDGAGDATASEVTIAASGAAGSGGDGEATEDNALFRDSSEGDFDLTLQVFDDRRVIREARLELHADDTRSAYDEIVGLAEAAGGFVANASVAPVHDEEAQPRVELTLRIPSDRLTPTLQAIKGVADEVVSETQGAQDVTDQFIDLEARLTNLQTLEVELRALLEEVRRQPDADPEKLLRVFNEISSVRGQIEQIQGQLDYLEDLTSLATLELSITQTPAAAPIVDEPWDPGEAVRDAVRNLVEALQGAAEVAISFGLFVLPLLLLILGIPAAIALYLYRRLRKVGDGSVESAPSS